MPKINNNYYLSIISQQQISFIKIQTHFYIHYVYPLIIYSFKNVRQLLWRLILWTYPSPNPCQWCPSIAIPLTLVKQLICRVRITQRRSTPGLISRFLVTNCSPTIPLLLIDSPWISNSIDAGDEKKRWRDPRQSWEKKKWIKKIEGREESEGQRRAGAVQSVCYWVILETERRRLREIERGMRNRPAIILLRLRTM